MGQVFLGLLVIAMLEVLDYLTGPYVTLELLYLFPVVWLAWTVGPVGGVVAAVLAGVGEFFVDLAWPQVTGGDVYAWNVFARTLVLALGAVAVARIRRTGELLTATNARLAQSLVAEAQAREEVQHRFGLLADALRDFAIVLFDRDGHAASWSAATARIAGRDPTGIVGRTFDELFPAAEREEATRLPMPTGNRVEVERWTARGSERYWANVVAYALGDVADRRTLAIVRDATARKVAEEHLRQARDEAVAAMRELEGFSYTVAHDLRSPLRAIEGYGAMLESDAGGRLDAATLAYVTRMRNAARRMGSLIDDLLEMSRLARAPLARADVDVTALVRAIDDQMRRAHPDRVLELRVEEGLRAHADPQLLAIVIRNLLENAWKFTAPRPAAVIEVGRAPTAPEPTFFVRDDGVGFDMRFVDKLFRPFERLHGVDEFEGTGIGLAIVRRIVERHGGRAWIEGAVDQGATAWFTLPEAPPAASGGA